jgi:hypothetical protein
MLSRIHRLAVLAVALAAPAAYAAPDKSDKPASKGPALLVRVQSINDLLKSVEYVGTLLPEEPREQLKQGLDLAKAFIDDQKGLGGVDVKNPIGLYINFGEEVNPTPPVVILVPIADRKTFLETLENTAMLKVEAPKNEDGVYKTEPQQIAMPVYFRFANGYAYITLQDEANIDVKALAKPADVLGGRPEHLVSATLRIDRLPDALKKMAIAGAENLLANAKDQPLPVEGKSFKEFRDKAVDELTANLKEVLDGGEEAALRLNVDPKAQEVALELELMGAKGSKLAKDIRSIRENKSVVGGAVSSSEAAATFVISASLPANLKKLWPSVTDDAFAQLLKQANVPGDIMTKAEPLVKAIMPTIKAGELDLGASLIGPNKDDKYTAIIGLKVVDGKKLESAIKDAVKELPPEVSGMIKLDDGSLPGGAKLHRATIADVLDENAQKVFGKSDLYFTFRDDLMLVAIGANAKDVLGKAVASKPADVGVVRIQAALSRVAPLAGENAQELAAAKKAAEKVFGKGAGQADLIKFSIDGGDSLKIKLSAQGKAIQFLAEVAAGKKDQ